MSGISVTLNVKMVMDILWLSQLKPQSDGSKKNVLFWTQDWKTAKKPSPIFLFIFLSRFLVDTITAI